MIIVDSKLQMLPARGLRRKRDMKFPLFATLIKELDVDLFATPKHWHVPAALMAIKLQVNYGAGKIYYHTSCNITCT